MKYPFYNLIKIKSLYMYDTNERKIVVYMIPSCNYVNQRFQYLLTCYNFEPLGILKKDRECSLFYSLTLPTITLAKADSRSL